jgi:type I restriction enzyme S subunit
VVAPKKLGQLETYCFSDAPSRARRVVSSDDILISTVRPNLKAFVRAEHLDCAHVASTGFAVLAPNNRTLGDLLLHAFFSSQFMVHCDSRVTGTSYPAINAKDVSDFVLRVPTDKNEQVEAAQCLNELAAASNLIDSHIEKCNTLHRQIIEALL